MDGQRFDRLARTVTSTTSRRATLGLLLGGGLAGFRTGAAQVEDQGRGLTQCRAFRDPCQRSRDCCRGLECRANGRCRYKNACGGKDGDFCEANEDCCDGFKCRNNANVCRACAERNQRCAVKADCCPGLQCQNRRCRS